MSFSKAKLNRFNDIQSSTPSPADYNVSLKSHVSGAAILKGERFNELRSPASSENGSFVSTGAPTFRTPHPPRRIKSQAVRKTKPTDLFMSEDNLEALKEKIVECNNKDQFIQDLTEQLEEVKEQLSKLEKHLSELNEQKSHFENTVQDLNTKHQMSLKDLQAKHQLDLKKLNEMIADLSNQMVKIKSDQKKLKEENKKDLTQLLEDIGKLEELNEKLATTFTKFMNEKSVELIDKHAQILKLEDEFRDLQQKHAAELEALTKKNKAEIQDIEFEMLETVTQTQNQLEKEKRNYDQLIEEKIKLTRDFEAVIKQREENFKETTMLAEMQMKEKCKEIEATWELKLQQAKDEADAILKECQAIAEYNIIQCEIEKNKALYDQSELRKSFEEMQKQRDTLQDESKNRQAELSSIIVELNAVREKSATEKKLYEERLEQATKDKFMYEVTISKTHTTIEALKRRLMNSDRDVEQLKAELEATEVSKFEFEERCNHLLDELQVITGLCDNVEEQNDLALRVAQEKVAILERELLEKVEYFKQESEKQVVIVTEELNNTKKEFNEAMEHLHEQQKLNIKAQELISTSRKEIERLEALTSSFETKIFHLEEKNSSLTDENKKLNTVIELMQTSEDSLVRQVKQLQAQCTEYEVYKTKTADSERDTDEEAVKMQEKYANISEKYDLLLKKIEQLEIENGNLRQKIAEQESLIGPFREHLEAYEVEYNALMNQKRNAEQEAKEMGMKYAQILGHQNQKQKIKHLMDLKKKNYDLAENNKDLENKLRAQTRIIEKLKKEISSNGKTPKKQHQPQIDNKENIPSPNHASNRITDSPSGPLRDRNN